jgi:hypothetical protein
MPLVKNTLKGNNWLEKINTDGDSCSRTAIRSYNRQYGSQGLIGNTRFYLPWAYEPGSHTLWVFVNGQKAVVEGTPTTNRQYKETSNRVVDFGASLNDTDIIEFIVAGSYLGEVSATSEGGGGLTWVLTGEPSVEIQNNYGYIADTTANPISFVLPANPEEGDTFGVADAFGNFGTNPATLDRNGNNIMGLAQNYVFDQDGMVAQFVFDGIDNWVMLDIIDHNKLYNYFEDRHRKITISTNNPTGGNNGDMWVRYFLISDGLAHVNCYQNNEVTP